MAEVKFEDALKKLEKIVGELESGNLPLEDSLKKYEEGIQLAQVCSKRLEQARKKIELIVKSKSGSFDVKPFEK